MIPNIDSRLIFLLGDPLRQSRAADLYNRWFEKHGENIFYFPMEIHSDSELDTVLKAARVLPFAGMGVTKPLKIKIMSYLDETDELTRAIGSANTVVVRDGKWIGYNTDGTGAIRSLRDKGYKIEGQSVFCFGAGGAARSVCFKLAREGAAHIYLTSLSDSAQRLSMELNNLFPNLATAIDAQSKDEIARRSAECSLVMNMSGVGMGKSEGQSPADAEIFRRGQLCFDAIYNPVKTKFLADAEKAGADILNGYGMFISQAALQLELWCGCGDITQELMEM